MDLHNFKLRSYSGGPEKQETLLPWTYGMQVHPPQRVPDRFVSRASARVRSVGAKAKSVENFYSRAGTHVTQPAGLGHRDTRTPDTLFFYYEGRDIKFTSLMRTAVTTAYIRIQVVASTARHHSVLSTLALLGILPDC